MSLLQQWITRLHFDQISSHFISIERSWPALQLLFWVQVDITPLMEFAPTAVHSSEDVNFPLVAETSVSRLSTVFAFCWRLIGWLMLPHFKAANLRESDSYAVGARSHLSAVLRVPAVKVAVLFCFCACRFPLRHNGDDDGENGRHGNGSSPKLTISPLSDACKRLICIYAN